MSLNKLDEALNIVSSLVIPFLEDDVDVIQKLDDEPNDVGGLTSSELKAKFDEAGNIIKKYLNETLVPQLSDTVAEAEARRRDEAERQENETARQEAESLRQNTFAAEVKEAKQAKQDADDSAKRAAQDASDAEAWAKGTRNGKPVAEDDPAYENNAKHYRDNAAEIVGPTVTPAQLAEVEKLAKAGSLGGGASGALDDLEIRVGSFVNAGAGWNSYRFPVPFEGTPQVILQTENFPGWAEIRSITAEGFLYCLRQPVYTEGSVSTGSYYTASGTASSSSHSSKTLVSDVTLPKAENKTTSEAVRVHWMAVEYNGDDADADR